MTHKCIMATAGNVHIRSIPSKELSTYARAYAQFNLSRRTPRHPGLLTQHTECPECGHSVGGALVATELLRLVSEHENQDNPLQKLEGAINGWFDFQAQCQTGT